MTRTVGKDHGLFVSTNDGRTGMAIETASKIEEIRTIGREALVADAVTKTFKTSREGLRRAVD
ncbi:MAG TPA: hypothetical protein VGQ86_05035, partial [Candidatus Limnocylindria bacterium]|nr:hypothetical protein [Candidatus Limnocylindria bacterium]